LQTLRISNVKLRIDYQPQETFLLMKKSIHHATKNLFTRIGNLILLNIDFSLQPKTFFHMDR